MKQSKMENYVYITLTVKILILLRQIEQLKCYKFIDQRLLYYIEEHRDEDP